MKTLLIMTAFFLAMGATINAKASTNMKQCKLETGEFGTIIGHGVTQDKAYENAATKCFDMRSEAYKKKYGKKADDDTALLYIDTCVNTQCA